MAQAVTSHRRRRSLGAISRDFTKFHRVRIGIDSAQYARSTTHARKNPPWQFAQITASGGSNQRARRNSSAVMKTTTNRKLTIMGRSTVTQWAKDAVANAAAIPM